MLKRITTNIASNMFDTINKIGDERFSAYEVAEEYEVAEAYEVELADTIAYEVAESVSYIVSLPTQKESPIIMKPTLICMYQVRTDSLYPFLLFLFQCVRDSNEVYFPSFSGNKKMKSVAYMKTIFPEADITYESSFETKDNNILILKAVMTNESVTNNYLWATSFDIMNKKTLMNYYFSPKVFDFFKVNPEFLRLKNAKNGIYETPMIGYYKTNTTSLDEMDIYRETIIPALGKCYYLLTDYTPGENIMRIAFFAGRMAVYTKNINDAKYDSILCCEHKRYMIKNYNQHIALN